MTARELRRLLFELDNQKLTISDLRYALFILPQDEKLTAGMIKAVLVNKQAHKEEAAQ